MKTLKLIRIVEGKEVVVLEKDFPESHEMFSIGGWPEVLTYQGECFALMDYDNNSAVYAPTSFYAL